MKPLIYLASPHYHEDWFTRELRYQLVKRAWMFFFSRGDLVFSPILHTHDVNMEHQPFEFYQQLDEKLIDVSDEVWVLEIPGTKESRGIASEVVYAVGRKKIVRFWQFSVLCINQQISEIGNDLIEVK